MLVVLDLDDTLYLERDYVLSGFACVDAWVRKRFFCRGFLEHAFALFLGGQRQNIVDDTLEHLSLPVEAGKEAVAVYREHAPSLRLPADSERFLERVQEQHPLALITDGRSHGQRAKIAALGISDVFRVTVVTGDIGPHYGKPHTGAFREVAAAATAARSCIYIADNPAKDFQAPKALGWLPSIRVRRPGSLHEAVPTPAHCAEVGDLDEALAHLCRIA